MFLDKIFWNKKSKKGQWEQVWTQNQSNLQWNAKMEAEWRKKLAEEKMLQIQPDSDTIVMPNFIRKWEGPFVYTSVYKIEKYPLTVSWFWLEDLFHMPNCRVNVEIIPVDKDIAREMAKKNISAYQRAAYMDQERWYYDEKLQDVIQENMAVQDSLSQNNLLQVSVTIAIDVHIDDKATINKIKRWDEKAAIDLLIKERDKLQDLFRRSWNFWISTKLTEFAYRQPMWLVASTPTFINQSWTYKEMLSQSAAWLFPFTSEIMNDQSGWYVMWINAATREPFAPNINALNKQTKVSNIHMCIFWVAGKWKSTLIMRMVAYELYKRTLIFDYAWDYLMMATVFKEDSYIKKYSLRSVQEGWFMPDDNFFHIPYKDWTNEPLFTIDEYISTVLLRSFTMLYPKLWESTAQRSILAEAFTMMYTKTDSTNSKLTRDPTGISLTIQDLKIALSLLLANARDQNKENIEDYTTLIDWLEPCFSGIYKHIFARTWESYHSDKNLTVIDLTKIREDVPLTSFVLTYNFILWRERFARTKDTFDREKRIIVDEAHRVTDNKYVMEMFSKAYKEARGEGIQVILWTQSCSDFLSTKENREILNNSWINIFFWQSPTQIKSIRDNMPWVLTERAMEFLQNDQVWQCVVSLWQKDFILITYNDLFTNLSIYKKDTTMKTPYWPDWFLDTNYIDREFNWAWSSFQEKLKIWYENQEKIREQFKDQY